MRTVHLGIIGAGLAVKHLHWPALQQLDSAFSVVAVCDTDLAAAREIAELTGGTATISDDYMTLLADERVEAVLISLPIHLNADVLRAATRAGKHSICEKPLASNLAQAEQLVADLAHAPVVIEIAENFHYRADLKQAREWMDRGRIGTIALISICARFWSDTSQGFGATPWRHDHQYRGAVIADGGVHHAAALRELGGEVEQLHAFTKDIHPVLKGPDTMVLNVRFRSGNMGHILFSGAARVFDPTFDEITVMGTEGSITINRNVARLYPANGEPEEYRSADPRGYVAEFRNFHAAITTGEPVVATLAEALADWRIIMRALDSAESRSVVLL